MKRIDVDPYSHVLIVKYRFLNKHWKREMDTKRKVMTLVKCSYSRGINAWMCPPIKSNIEKLWEWGFSFPTDFAELAGQQTNLKKKVLPYHNIKVPEYLDFLRPYQKEAFQFIKWREGRALIGDEMGTGKSWEALAWIRYTIRKGPALLIVPSSTKPQWERLYKRVIDKDVEVLYGRTTKKLTRRSYIINWDILTHWKDELLKVNFETLIPDECQMMGNLESLRTKAIMKLAKRIPSFIPMSGTPITSRPKQFYPMLHCLDKKAFPSEWKFLNRYCVKQDGYGGAYTGSSHEEELHVKISRLMIRRLKRDVLKDLPPLTTSIVPMDIGKYIRKYNKLERTYFDTYDPHSHDRKDQEKDFYNLKMQVFDMKLDSIVKWIDQFITSDKKLLVGVWHKYVIETLHNKYKKNSVMINGSVTGTKRETALHNFYEDKQICFLQLKSGGVGLDGLQDVCSNAALVELGDTPTMQDQFTSRIDRSGQTEPMNVYYLLGEGTIEEDLIEILDETRKMLDSVVDGKKTKQVDLLTALYKKRRKK